MDAGGLMRVPTVRVKSPSGGFMTINAADFGEHHELHDVQAEDFVHPHDLRSREVKATGGVTDPEAEVRIAAAGFVERMMAAKHDMILESYRELPAAERLSHIGEAADEMQAALDRRSAERTRQYEEAEREQAASDAAGDLRVARGPRGLWYVMRGDERLSVGHPTEDAANAAKATHGV